MAIPKVFVSSTCYDLQEERAQLERFILSYGFQPVLSEYSGVYYDIDAHTHESCVNEVAHCDLFVLIISGRYGGRYKGGNGESITQAEYIKARDLGLPIFTFVKADVSSAQHYYKENTRAHDEKFASQINYPAIEKQSDAVPIFNFIESVHRADTNNGIETYQSFSDIEKHLRKQWAGLFFSFLQKRKEEDKAATILGAVDKLLGSTATLESLVESLHTNSFSEQETKKLIHDTEIRQQTRKFFKKMYNTLGSSVPTVDIEDDAAYLNEQPLEIEPIQLDECSTIEPVGNWIDYVDSLPMFSATRQNIDDAYVVDLSYRDADFPNHLTSSEDALLSLHYNKGVKHSTEQMRKEILHDIFENFIPIDL